MYIAQLHMHFMPCLSFIYMLLTCVYACAMYKMFKMYLE